MINSTSNVNQNLANKINNIVNTTTLIGDLLLLKPLFVDAVYGPIKNNETIFNFKDIVRAFRENEIKTKNNY